MKLVICQVNLVLWLIKRDIKVTGVTLIYLYLVSTVLSKIYSIPRCRRWC